MPADAETTAALAAIQVGQENVTATLVQLRADMREAADKGERTASKIHDRVNEIGTSVTELHGEHATLSTMLDAHTAEDNRRFDETDRKFSLLWRILQGAGILSAVGAGGYQVIG